MISDISSAYELHRQRRSLAMQQNLYVYFKLDGQPQGEIERALKALQAELRVQFPGITAQLMRRRDDAQTWMEVYEGINNAAAFGNALHAGLTTHGLARYGLARHEEWFVPLEWR